MAHKENAETQILDTAQRLMQTHGYCGFSYADIAGVVGIQKASIHYYFPGKADLGIAAVARYREEFARIAERIRRTATGADESLPRYAQIFRDMLRGSTWPHDWNADGGRICLCGALTSEWASLPEGLRAEVREFFEEQGAWLADILEEGRAAGGVDFSGRADVQAQALLAGLQGAMQSARVLGDAALYCTLAHRMLAQLGLDTLERDTLDRRGAALVGAV